MTHFQEISQEFLDKLYSGSHLTDPLSSLILNNQQRAASLGEALGGIYDFEPDNPLGNTGLFCNEVNNSQQVVSHNNQPSRFAARVHWLQGTFSYSEHPCLTILGEKLELLFEDTFEWNCGAFSRGMKFQDSACSANGIRMAWVRPRDSKCGTCWLSIPGSALDRLIGDDGDDSKIYMLFHLLHTGTVGSTSHEIFWNWKTTRLDTAVDDLEKKIRPKDILPIAEAGNFTGFRNKPVYDQHKQEWLPPSYSYHESAACDADGNVIPAGTLYFGSGQSDKTLYIYDKFLESDGAIDSVRWEARWKDDYAHVRFFAICECLFDQNVKTLPEVIAAMTTAAIDFIDIKSATRVCNCKRLPFWDDILQQIGRVKYPLRVILPLIEKTINWLEHQVSTSLAMIDELAGFEDLMNGLIDLKDMGLSRLNKTHRVQIEQAKKSGFNFSEYLHQILNKRRRITDTESMLC